MTSLIFLLVINIQTEFCCHLAE